MVMVVGGGGGVGSGDGCGGCRWVVWPCVDSSVDSSGFGVSGSSFGGRR